MTPFHHQLEFRSSTVSWFGTDQAHVYDQNLQDPDRRAQLTANGWIDRDITYSFNSHGFRCAEFEPGTGFVALGCSITAGVGLSAEQIWPSIVGKNLGISAWNLGVSGGAMDTNFRMAEYWLPVLQPRFVVMLGSPLRIELVHSDVVDSFQLNRYHKDDWYLKNYTLNDENDGINYRKNVRAISDVCRDVGALFWSVSTEDWGQGPGDPDRGRDWARDLAHPGPSMHRHFADRVMREFMHA